MLHVEQLESRDTPAFIAGFDGPETVVYADLNGDHRLERIVAAGIGGSARVEVTNGDGNVLANFIAFEDEFRGGGSITVVGDQIVIVPGPGGGARLVTYRLGDGFTSSVPLPAPEGYRGGATIVASNRPGEVLTILDERLIRFDLGTLAVPFSAYVGPDWRFEPTGGWYEDRGRIFAVLDRGPVIDSYVAESMQIEVV